ncbi:hypothetical protein V8C42DRAFT_338570 [Trichoderma barbatum]
MPMATFHSSPSPRNLQPDEGFTCNCGCSYCAVGRRCLAYLFPVPGGPASTSLQPTDLSFASLSDFSSAAFQAAGFPPPSLAVFPAAFPAACFSAGFQSEDLLSINALPAEASSAGFPSLHLSSHGLHSIIAASSAAAGSSVTAPAAGTGTPPVSDVSESQAIVVESLTYTPSNRYKCLSCEVSFQTPRFLNRHINSVHLMAAYICQSCEKSFSRSDTLIAHEAECPSRGEAQFKDGNAAR